MLPLEVQSTTCKPPCFPSFRRPQWQLRITEMCQGRGMPSPSCLADCSQRDFAGSWRGHTSPWRCLTVPVDCVSVCVTRSCISGRLFILVPAQSSRISSTGEPKLFLQGLFELQWEAVIAAWTGSALPVHVWPPPGDLARIPSDFGPKLVQLVLFVVPKLAT